MQPLNSQTAVKPIRPERIIQFGEGNFLRAFVEWMVQRMNQHTDFNASVVVVKPRPGKGLERLQAQDCLYHVNLQGLDAGHTVDSMELIDCISRAVNPYDDHAAFLALAALPSVRFVVSNTTEAGIAFDPSCRLCDTPPTSFPAKLTQMLYHRFRAFSGDLTKGLIILPCELIFENGCHLRECVLQYIDLWREELGNDADDFREWFLKACPVCSTLVDRIVPGFPQHDAERLQTRCGFTDQLLIQAEAFHLWVIEATEGLSTSDLSRELPVAKAGLNVHFVENEAPYHQRKVTLLNGTHSVLAPIGLLAGISIVRDACQHPVLGPFLRRVMLEELLPSVDLPEDELRTFADSVWERFLNPFIDHQLPSIMLNAVAKYQTRDLPALKIDLQRNGHLPRGLVLGLAAIVAQVSAEDQAAAAKLMAEVPGLADAVKADLQAIHEHGILSLLR